MILEYYGIKEITAEDDARIKKDYIEARRIHFLLKMDQML